MDGDTNESSSATSAGNNNSTSNSRIPTPPDNGALAYALKTGFSSSQGALLQMIEFAQQTVSGDSKEIGLALLLLLFFALAASAYVMKEGEQYTCINY